MRGKETVEQLFTPELMTEAENFLQGAHPQTSEELKAQTGLVDEKGLVRQVFAVDLEALRLVQAAGSGSVTVESIAAVLAAEEHSSEKNAFWATLKGAEQLKAGVQIRMVPMGETAGNAKTAYVAVLLQPGSTEGALWNPKQLGNLKAALMEQIQAIRTAHDAEAKKLEADPQLDEQAGAYQRSIPHTADWLAKQDGRLQADGTADFLAAVSLDELHSGSIYQLVPVTRIAAAVAEKKGASAGKLQFLDTLMRAESGTVGIDIAGETADTLLITVSVKPGPAQSLWNPADPEVLEEEILKQLNEARQEGVPDASSIERERDVQIRAESGRDKVLAAPPEISTLESQNGVVNRDGVIEFTSAIDLNRLCAGRDCRIVPINEVAAAVTGSKAHTGGPGKALLWETLQKAEQIRIGVSATQVIPDVRTRTGSGESTSDAVFVTICVRPLRLKGQLWNPYYPGALERAIYDQMHATHAGEAGTCLRDENLNDEAQKLLKSASALSREELESQSGTVDDKGRVSFIAPIRVEELLKEAVNCNLISLDDAVAAVCDLEQLHLSTAGSREMWKAFAESQQAKIGLAASPLTETDGDVATSGVVWVQFVMELHLPEPMWDKDKPEEYAAAIYEQIAKERNGKGYVTHRDENIWKIPDLEKSPDVFKGFFRLTPEMLPEKPTPMSAMVSRALALIEDSNDTLETPMFWTNFMEFTAVDVDVAVNADPEMDAIRVTICGRVAEEQS